jgi:DNA polymerase-3 subunit delta
MSFTAFLKEIEKGLPAPVYLFYTSDPFLIREAVDAVKGLVPADARDFNLHIFDLLIQGDENLTIEKVLNVANTVSFFGGRRFTVLILNLQKLSKKDAEKLHSYVLNPAEGSVVVILHTGVLKKDAREKLGALKSIPLDIRESEISSWIKQRARIRGVNISDEACEYLISLTGTDLGLLASEIEKISLIGREMINPDDISDILTGGRLYGVFDLADALRANDAERVFRIYKTIRQTAEDYGLIGALNWQYSRGLRPKINKKEKDYLLKVFELLNQADVDIKSSGRNFPMEYLLIKLLRLQGSRSPSW